MSGTQGKPDADTIRKQVRDGYAQIALQGQQGPSGCGCCGPSAPTTNRVAERSGCCGPSAPTTDQVAESIGYNAQDLFVLPDGANLGLSCGNPTARASLRPGEIVLDLGSGAGFDAFIAAQKVGPQGRIIGVDMTPEMIAKARRNVVAYRDRTGLDNVEFRLGEIERLPVADGSVDVVISNCVLNLSPDKPQVWREIARVLKPGGRVAISDLALRRPLPESLRTRVEALIGCIAGAALVEDTQRMAEQAGLTDVVLTTNPAFVETMNQWNDPFYEKIIADLPAGAKPGDYVTTLLISARARPA